MYYKEKKYRKLVNFYIDQALHEKRQFMTKNSGTEPTTSLNRNNIDEELGECTNLFNNSNSSCLLDDLIKHDNKLSDLDIRNQVFIATATGYETIAVQSAQIILLLAMHPQIQTKLFDEINEIVVSDQNRIDCDVLEKLCFMENVIFESMRLFPVVPFTCRKIVEDFTLEDLSIPKNLTVFINFYSLHRRNDLWGESSHLFNPDNFLPQNVEKREPGSFLPFSTGNRSCIGE